MKAFQLSVRMRPEPEGFRFYFFHTKIRGTSFFFVTCDCDCGCAQASVTAYHNTQEGEQHQRLHRPRCSLQKQKLEDLLEREQNKLASVPLPGPIICLIN